MASTQTPLVTGATGFIGGHLVDALLRRGERPRCLYRSSLPSRLARNSAVHWVQGTLENPESLAEAVRGASVVYHLAGKTSAVFPREMRQANELGTRNLLEACARQPVPPTVVVVSSIAASGPTRKGHQRTERERPAPISAYGRSKLAAEREALAYAQRVPVTVVRPGIVFGERDHEFVAMIRAIDRTHIHVYPAWWSPKLSCIHVTDLVELLLAAAARGQRATPLSLDDGSGRGIYFACDPEHYTYVELGALVGKALGQRLTLRLPATIPGALLVAAISQAVSRLTRRPTSLNIDKIRESWQRCWACSPEAARRELGVRPDETLIQRLQQTCNWYRGQKAINDLSETRPTPNVTRASA